MSVPKIMSVFENVLKASRDVDYVVRGGRSYLEKLPASALRVLGAAMPEFFTKNDWNVSVASTDGAEVLCARAKKAYAAAKIRVKITRVEGDKYIVMAGRVQVGWITDTSRSKVGLTDPRCPPTTRKGVKYSSLCDCLSQMHRALTSDTFAKREKTGARCRAVLNLYTGRPSAYTAGIIKALRRDLAARSRRQMGGCNKGAFGMGGPGSIAHFDQPRLQPGQDYRPLPSVTATATNDDGGVSDAMGAFF